MSILVALVEEVIADHFKSLTEQNNNNIYQLLPAWTSLEWKPVMHQLTVTESVLAAQVRKILLFSYILGYLSGLAAQPRSLHIR